MKRLITVLVLIAVAISSFGISMCVTSAEDKDITIKMQIGAPKMSVNGEEISIDEEGTVPVIVNERTLVPIRAIIEHMGGKVNWSDETRTVKLDYDKDRIELVIDNTTAFYNGEDYVLDTAPTIINERTMLPIRFIAESFGFEVAWDGGSQTVTITSSKSQQNENILVAYFTLPEPDGVDAESGASRVIDNGEVKGAMQYMAQIVADETGGDMFQIKTVKTYSTPHSALIAEAQDEQKNNIKPELATHIEDLDKYDTIFIGYPIWWSDLPSVMYSFFDEYDFSGKKLVLLSSHGGSRLAGTPEMIAELEPDAVIEKNVFTVERGNVPECESDLREWVKAVGYGRADKATTDTTAATEAGLVRGNYDNGIYEYLGVPYAEAKEMFVKADKVTPWEGVFDATKYGDTSIQGALFGGAAAGVEDGTSNNCQNLNIWTPSINDGEKRAVMVWLHGGGFSTGSANSEECYGENLSRSGDVVVVGVNHRLNVFGHLDLSAYGEKYKNSENVGIQDIVDALTWVQNNIESFGGDPDNVTLFGESGGGAKVLALMTTPYAKGLFHRGIVESGATEGMGVYFSKKEVSAALGARILEKLNISPDNVDDIQKVSITELQTAATEAQQEIAEEYKVPVSIGEGYAYEWEPVVDGDFLPTDPVLDYGFAEAGKDIPLLIGSNLNEWTTFMSDLARNNMTDEEKAEYAKAYPNEDPETAPLVDTLIRKPMLKIMSHKADQNGAKVYAYIFTKQIGEMGSYHTAEIPFVFNNVTAEAEKKLSNTMSAAWVNFAKTGVPSAEGLDVWESYTRENMATMILDDTSYLTHNHDIHLMELLEPEYKY